MGKRQLGAPRGLRIKTFQINEDLSEAPLTTLKYAVVATRGILDCSLSRTPTRR